MSNKMAEQCHGPLSWSWTKFQIESKPTANFNIIRQGEKKIAHG